MAHHHAPVFKTSCRPFSGTFRTFHENCKTLMAESMGVEPISLLRVPLLSRQVPYRPAHSPLIRGLRHASLLRPRQLLALSRRSRWLTRFIRGLRHASLLRPRQLLALSRRSRWLTRLLKGS